MALVVAVVVATFSVAAHASAVAMDPVSAVHVDIIGDSLSTGFRTPGDTWPEEAQGMMTGQGLNVQITSAAENGAGYVTPGEDGDVFLDLVNSVVNSQSQVVVLFGSDNDTGQAGIPQAVQDTLARVKVLAPDATVIVVGPTSESGDPNGELTLIRQTLALSAKSIGARYVDPVTLTWFQGADAKYLSDDLEHPNASGETYLAVHMDKVMTPAIKAAMRQDHFAGFKPGP